MHSRLRDAAVGFAGGLVGGLTAMPGAVADGLVRPARLGEDHQRGLIQPFIAAMQCVALALLVSAGSFVSDLVDLVVPFRR